MTSAGSLHPAFAMLASALREKHPGTCAILAYGSTLRDASPHESLIDLYVLTENWRGVSSNPISQLACRLVPPNVYYAECLQEQQIYRAKYAVLPIKQFAKRMEATTGNPYFWARFCQPSRIVWARDDTAQLVILAAFQKAAATALGHAHALAPNADLKDQWIRLFQNTYKTELRPESSDRATLIFEANSSHYAIVSKQFSDSQVLRHNWSIKRWHGKFLSVLRLIKAAFTFQGGADYSVWKIKRHSGVEIKLTDFQRRHPLFAAVMLLPALLQKGAVR